MKPVSDTLVVASEDIAAHFNELRSDILLLYECRMALASCQFELESLRHQYQTLTGQVCSFFFNRIVFINDVFNQELPIPSHLRIGVDELASSSDSQKSTSDGGMSSGRKRISEVIDVAGGSLPQVSTKFLL